MLSSGFVCLIALSRSGVRLFWVPEQIQIPRLRLTEAAPIILLLTTCIALTWEGRPVMSYLEDTAHYLDQPRYTSRRYCAKIRSAPLSALERHNEDIFAIFTPALSAADPMVVLNDSLSISTLALGGAIALILSLLAPA